MARNNSARGDRTKYNIPDVNWLRLHPTVRMTSLGKDVSFIIIKEHSNHNTYMKNKQIHTCMYNVLSDESGTDKINCTAV